MAGEVLASVAYGTIRGAGRQACSGSGHQGPDADNNCTHSFDPLPPLQLISKLSTNAQQAYYLREMMQTRRGQRIGRGLLPQVEGREEPPYRATQVPLSGEPLELGPRLA